ncbi:BT1A1 protein, partial [Tachuris rubrigastra]|nr:BT1A1 protein [Tachuris rubrigastra]
VTLDPSTAHPQLVVAPDGSSVRWEPPQVPPGEGLSPPDPPDPLDPSEPSVLGRPGVSAGRCCWDVEVAPEGSWALGVVGEPPESGTPPGQSPPCAGGDLWSMGLCQGQVWALTGRERVPLARVRVPRRVRVSLDHDGGRVAFFDADSRALIFAFPAASFGGRGVRP